MDHLLLMVRDLSLLKDNSLGAHLVLCPTVERSMKEVADTADLEAVARHHQNTTETRTLVLPALVMAATNTKAKVAEAQSLLTTNILHLHQHMVVVTRRTRRT
jgi:hypothetical protein